MALENPAAAGDASLVESEARLRALVAAAAYATYRMSADWSEVLEVRSNDPAVQSLGVAWLQQIPEEDRPAVTEALGKARAEKSSVRLEHRIRRADGRMQWMLSRAVPVLNASGEIGEWFGALSDITEQKRAEHSAQRLAAIVESSDDAIVSKDLNGIIMTWNSGAERIFGYSADEVVGRHISVLIPADRLDEEPGIIERIRRGERIEHYETVRQRKDGSFIDISLTVSPILFGGKVVGASKIARDVTERKQQEMTRQLLLNELNHRVKNTLATVQAIAQQTLRRTRDPADFSARFSGRIQSLARVHSLLTESTWQGADLRHLIRDQLLGGAVDEARLTVWGPAVRLGAQTAVHMALVLHELGTNSVKYGSLSVPNGNVSVSWTVRDDRLRLKWVERGGPPCVTPFTRGFGTTLIEQSAKGEGGEAEMLCDAEGVSWDISLPLPLPRERVQTAVGPPESAAPPVTRDAPAPPAAALDGLRFLVIEDEPMIALDLIDSLKKAGARAAQSAGTAAEALQLIANAAFDAALLDANLHGASVEEIAAALARRGTPFLFVTGYGRAGLPESFRQAPVVAKPFSEQQLLGALELMLSRDARVVQTPLIRG